MKDEDNNNEIELFNNENKSLMVSSLFYLIPGIHAYSKKQYLLSSSLFIGSIISYKFWSKPRYDIWRTADIISANTAMGLFIGNMAWNINIPNYKYIISSLYFTGGSCYAYAIDQYNKKNKKWYIYHLSLHIFMWLGHSLNICATNQLK
tara:strand:- start:50 stop:496 length:447 start_codon:yes stop_codon:yes gene_type:complete